MVSESRLRTVYSETVSVAIELMPTARELLRFLRQNGYKEVRQTGSYLIPEHPERCSLVIPIHRGKDIPISSDPQRFGVHS